MTHDALEPGSSEDVELELVVEHESLLERLRLRRGEDVKARKAEGFQMRG